MTALYPEVERESEIARLRDLVEQAQALVVEISRQSEADRRAFELAYRLGFEAGVDVGRGRAEHEAWQRGLVQAEAIKRHSRTWTAEELKGLESGRYLQAQVEYLRSRSRWLVADQPCEPCEGLGFISRAPLDDRLCVHCNGLGAWVRGAA